MFNEMMPMSLGGGGGGHAWTDTPSASVEKSENIGFVPKKVVIYSQYGAVNGLYIVEWDVENDIFYDSYNSDRFRSTQTSATWKTKIRLDGTTMYYKAVDTNDTMHVHYFFAV